MYALTNEETLANGCTDNAAEVAASFEGRGRRGGVENNG